MAFEIKLNALSPVKSILMKPEKKLMAKSTNIQMSHVASRS